MKLETSNVLSTNTKNKDAVNWNHIVSKVTLN